MQESPSPMPNKAGTRLDQLRNALQPETRFTRLNRRIRMVLIVVGIPYLVLFLYALFFSDKIIFQPEPLQLRAPADILKLKDSAGTSIAALYLPNENATRTILYSYGNAEDIEAVRSELQKLHDLGFAIMAYDYPGYGFSGGSPSEQGAYRAIDAAYAHLTQTLKIAPENIVIMGRSLGGGVSVDLAAREKIGGLILQSTFKSAFRVLTNWRILPFDKFNSIGKIRNVKCPILITHGTADEVISFQHGTTLFEAANEPKQFYPVPGARHNNVVGVGGKAYEKALLDFLNSLPPPSK